MSNEETEKHWMDEENGVPHKNGHVRFYFVGFEESVHGYLGWFDMTDWDEGWKKVWKAAEEKVNEGDGFQVLRHDQLLDLMRNVQYALEEALEDKDETTWIWWLRKKWKEEEEAKLKGESK
jgi:hypothetical protein